jgi:hypothetical protein
LNFSYQTAKAEVKARWGIGRLVLFKGGIMKARFMVFVLALVLTGCSSAPVRQETTPITPEPVQAEENTYQNYINSRVERMLTIFFDTTENKYNGFIRTGVNEYTESGVNANTHIMRFLLENNDTPQVMDMRVFRSIAYLDALKCKGAYLTALENKGFSYLGTEEEGDGYAPIGSLRYYKQVGEEEKMICVFVIEKKTDNVTTIQVIMF